MRSVSFRLSEALLAIPFLGLFLAVVVREWGKAFFIHGIVVTGILGLMTYLVLLLMIRHHRERNRTRGRTAHDDNASLG